MKMKKKDVFIKFANLEDKFTYKYANLAINSTDIDKILECLFLKGNAEHNIWVKGVIKDFLKRKKY